MSDRSHSRKGARALRPRPRTVALTLAIAGFAAAASRAQEPSDASAWRQWGGPGRNFHVAGPALAESWPEAGPPTLWRRPLGTGHSAILVEQGRLYTMYRPGDASLTDGPWQQTEVVVALDAKSGETLWEHRYPSAVQDFGRGPGPHSTPLIVGNRLFTVGTNRHFFALDKTSGEVLWQHDLVADLGAPELQIRPIVKSGYGCSPIAWKDTVICFVGGPGQSVAAFRQSDGEVVWRSGHFLISAASPILIDVDGQPQVAFFAGSLVTGLDPDTGEVLWAHAHDAGNDFNLSLPVWGDDQILFLSSAYRAGSRALQLHQSEGITSVEELWFTNRVKFQFLNAVRIGHHVYGTHGERGAAFLTAVDVRTGENPWRERGYGQSTLLHADGKLIVLTEDGDLALVRVSAHSADELARTELFDTKAWTVPTLVGTTLYARDRAEIVALDMGVPR
jgi:outer membrane protein assembly factor BamB